MIIGLDGATFDIMGDWLAGGLLPNIASVSNSGSQGVLRSTVPPVTPAAWTTFMTGKNPGKHGIFSFERRSTGSYEQHVTCGGMRRSRTVWDIMNDHRLSVGVVHVPYTYPPDHVNGYMISGMDAPAFDRRIFHPASLYGEVTSEVGAYSLARVLRRGDHYDLDSLRAQIDGMGAAAKLLLERHPVDVFAVVFTPTDHVAHQFLTSRTVSSIAGEVNDLVEWTYRRVDARVGELLRFAGPETTVIIMSDHGMAPINRGVNLNRALMESGFLHFQGDEGTQQAGRQRPVSWARRALVPLSSAAQRAIPRHHLRRIARRFGFLRKLHWWVSAGGIAWGETSCYTMAVQGLLRLNVQGRDPKGPVESGEEYETTREAVAQTLLGLRDPESGRPLIEQVYRSEDIYDGPWIEEGPDLVVAEGQDAPWGILRGLMGADAPLIVSREEADQRAVDLPEGWHRPNGIFMARGPEIAQTSGTWNIADVAPTMLHLLGLPIPDDMDGVLMEEVLAGHASRRELVREAGQHGDAGSGGAYTEDDEQAVRDQLSGLGYLD